MISAISLCFTMSLLAGDPVVLKTHADRVDVIIQGRHFTTYYVSSVTAKPYLMPLRTPSGITISRSFPEGNDVLGANPREPSFEPHQRPLFFGHGDVNGLDFWGEQAFDRFFTDHAHQPYGHLILKSLVELPAKEGQAGVRGLFRMLDSNGREIGEEVQTYTFRGDERTRTIDCEFLVRTTTGPIVLGDTKEGTFGIRLIEELSAPHDHMLNSHGSRGERPIWGKPADWVSYSGEVGGKAVGIAVFDSPTSFRHPTTWHARAYGLLAANPFGLRAFTKDSKQDGSTTIAQGQAIEFRYRVLIFDGEFSPALLEEKYRQYAAEK